MHVGDIDVMIDVYIYCLLQWNVKKLQFSRSLPSAMGKALGKVFPKKIQKFFAECLGWGTRQSNFLKK